MLILGLISGQVAAEIAASNSALSEYLIGHGCQQCQPRLNTEEEEAPTVDLAGNQLFNSNQVGAFVGYPSVIINFHFYLYKCAFIC